MPASLAAFGAEAVQRVLADPLALPRALGEWLTEPKPQVWFHPGPGTDSGAGAVRLDARTRMLYDAHHLFVNGESWRVGGRDARLLRQLADTRHLGAAERLRLGADARATLQEWLDDGWAHEETA